MVERHISSGGGIAYPQDKKGSGLGKPMGISSGSIDPRIDP